MCILVMTSMILRSVGCSFRLIWGGSLEVVQRNHVLFTEYGSEQSECMPYSSLSGKEFKHVTQAPLVASDINANLGCHGWLQACSCEGHNFVLVFIPTLSALIQPITHPTFHYKASAQIFYWTPSCIHRGYTSWQTQWYNSFLNVNDMRIFFVDIYTSNLVV